MGLGSVESRINPIPIFEIKQRAELTLSFLNSCETMEKGENYSINKSWTICHRLRTTQHTDSVSSYLIAQAQISKGVSHTDSHQWAS